MIGLFDSGHGGLTVLKALAERFPQQRFLYLGDHANAPYGNRPSEEVVDLTRAAVAWLFDAGCPLVMLACNTATAVACRTLQRDWLPASGRRAVNLPPVNILGIVAPTVEAATQTPWAITTPQYPQKYMTDTIAVFGTARTIASGVYQEEIRKRCPRVKVVQQACPRLAGAIEAGAHPDEIDGLVAGYVADLMAATEGERPDRAILGCTHFPLIEGAFRRHLPAGTRLLSQPGIVADSLEDYVARHPEYLAESQAHAGTSDASHNGTTGERIVLLTTGNSSTVSGTLGTFWSERPAFRSVDLRAPLPG
jgi:glutamate racemase